jgi:hypothetical protein
MITLTSASRSTSHENTYTCKHFLKNTDFWDMTSRTLAEIFVFQKWFTRMQ